MVDIFIAEDQEVVRLGLKAALTKAAPIKIVGEADNGLAAAQEVAAKKPSVVLVDLDLPLQGGIETTRSIKQSSPETRVVVFTSHTDDSSLFQAIEAGADAYVVKSSDIAKLLGAIEAVIQGAVWLDPAVGTKVMKACTSRLAPAGVGASGTRQDEPPNFLSEREKEIVKLIAAGMGNQAIAKRLYLSIDTVKTHVRHIMSKMSANNRTEAAVKAIKMGMLVDYQL